MSELDIVTTAAKEIKNDVQAGKSSLAKIEASSISRELVAAIAQKIAPERVAEAISQMLDARRELKDGTILPDTRANEAGVKFYLHYMIGMPVQRQEVITVNVGAETEAGMMDRLKSSPALRASFRKILDAAEAPAIEG